MENEPFYPTATSSKVMVMEGTVKKSMGAVYYPQVSPWFDWLLWQ